MTSRPPGFHLTPHQGGAPPSLGTTGLDKVVQAMSISVFKESWIKVDMEMRQYEHSYYPFSHN